MIRRIQFYLYVLYVSLRWFFFCSFGYHKWKKAKHFDGFWCSCCYAKGMAKYYRAQEIEEIEHGDNLSLIVKSLQRYL